MVKQRQPEGLCFFWKLGNKIQIAPNILKLPRNAYVMGKSQGAAEEERGQSLIYENCHGQGWQRLQMRLPLCPKIVCHNEKGFMGAFGPKEGEAGTFF